MSLSNPVVIVLGVLVLFGGVLLLIKKLSSAAPMDETPRSDADYEVRKSILTPAERSFFGVLQPLLPEDVSCLIKVSLGEVFTLREDLGFAERLRASSRIGQKHVDFLLVRASDLKPLAGIALDAASPDADATPERDAVVDEVFQSCKVPLLHVKARATYNFEALRESVTAVLLRASEAE